VHSSIFSFSSAISSPVRTGLAALIIVVAYNILVAVIHPRLMMSYDAGTRNHAIAERYVDEWHGRSVLVGSSLSFLLSPEYMSDDALGPNIYNFGLSSDCAATGLQVIIRKREWPRLVFVEMNVMERSLNRELADYAFPEPWRTIRSVAPGFRLGNRPIDLTIVWLWRTLRALLAHGGHQARQQAFSPAAPAVDQLDDAYRDRIETNLALVKEQIDALRKHGVKIILVHFPVHQSIENGPRAQYLWRRALEYFPSDRNEWLDVGKSGSYETTDGIHLTISSARQFSAVLRQVEGAEFVH
jgi:hypothetical protein